MLSRFFGAEQFGKFPAFVRPVAEHPAHWNFCSVGHLRHLLILCLLTHQQNERMSVPREENCFRVYNSGHKRMSALGHVWTAPWQELSDAAAALVGCGHVSGLFVRPMWPLAIMRCADRVPIVNTHSKMR